MSERSVRTAAEKRWARVIRSLSESSPFATYGREVYVMGAVAGHRATAVLVPLALAFGAIYGMAVVHLSYALPDHFLSSLAVALAALAPWLATQWWKPSLTERLAAKLL